MNLADFMTRRTVAVAVLILGVTVLATGCRKPPQSVNGDAATAGPKGDPWETASRRLKKETDLTACRSVLGELSNNLSGQENGQKLPGLSADAEAALSQLVPLIPEDLAEIRGAAFSSHDPVYLAECLYLRDAARSLELPGLPPEHQADLGFAWVCRQVCLNPWLIEVQSGLQMATALPPAYVLRRGSGSGLERMYVFLALLQQMGLDGCLIGPPDAGDKPAGFVAYAADKKTVLSGTPRGPFWAVGVRVGNDVRLYDPWRGQPFPAPLKQLKANPTAYQTWFDDAANTAGTTPADAQAATVYLAVPVNSLAPRMALLEEKLKADVGVRLAINPAKLQAAFPDPKPAFWNPPTDRFAYGRAARGFLPTEEGGADRTERSPGRLYEAYLESQLPPEIMVVPPELLPYREVIADVGIRVAQYARGAYGYNFLNPPMPRERLHRGFFQDAAKDLVAKQDSFAKGLERIRNNRDTPVLVRDWAETARELYNDLGRVGLDSDPAGRAAAAAQAQARIDMHWRNPAVVLLVDRVVSEVGQAEATYLLALCKHEQAERAQARLDYASGGDLAGLKQDAAIAWEIALREWQTYRAATGTHSGFPGRAQHARQLAERAERLAAQR